MREALQSLQRQVVRQERLAAVGVLVSGVAHELNNPLQAILGTARAARARPGVDRRRARRDRVRQDAERPRARDHPQPVALQQPAVGPADARRPARRHRRGGAAAAPRPRNRRHRARRRDRRRRDRCTRTSPRSNRSRSTSSSTRSRSIEVAGRAQRTHPDSRLRRRQARPRSRCRTMAPACRRKTSRSCFSRSSRPNPWAKAPASACRSATASSSRYGGIDRPPRQRMGRRDVLLRAAGDRCRRALRPASSRRLVAKLR